MSYFRKRGGLVAAMEDLSEDLPADGTEPTEPVIDMDEETAEGVDAIADETSESEAITDDLEDASGDLEMVDNIIDTAEDTVTPDPENPTEEPEGMDEVAAEIAQEAISRAFARLGIHPGEIVTPSTEAFKSANSRVMATQAAVESWKEGAGRAWKAFAEAVKQMWERFMKFLDGLFNQVTRMRKNVAEMKKSVAASVDGTGEISAKGWGGAFAHKGVDPASIVAVLTKQNHAADSVMNVIENFESAISFYDMSKSKAQDTKASTGTTAFVDAFSKVGGFDHDSDGFVMKELVGGKTIKIGTNDKAKVTVSFEGEATTPPDKTARFSKAEMGQILTGIEGVLRKTEELKKSKARISQVLAKANKIGDKTGNYEAATRKEGNTKDNDITVSAIRSELMAVSIAANKIATAVPGMNIKACAAAIKAVSASLSGGKPADKKEESK